MANALMDNIKKRKKQLDTQTMAADDKAGAAEPGEPMDENGDPMDPAEKALHVIVKVKSLQDLKDLAHGRKKYAPMAKK